MSFRLVPKLVRWHWMTLNDAMAFILRYFIEFCNFRGALRKSDKAINKDNIRLLCLVVNVCRGTARRPRYKYFITARWKFCSRFINSWLNAQYLPSYHIDIGSRTWAFDWYQNRWPCMTLNGEMALILHYLTEFGCFRAHWVKVVDKAITMDNLWLRCLVVNVCRGTARRPRDKYTITARWKFCSRFINSRLNAQYLPSYRLIC